jgi:hypothetical protein
MPKMAKTATLGKLTKIATPFGWPRLLDFEEALRLLKLAKTAIFF